MANYLANGYVMKDMSAQQRKKLIRDVKKYIWDDSFLFRIGVDRILRRCVSKEEGWDILRHVHEGLTGVEDALEIVRTCDACQWTDNISSKNEMPQNPIQILEIFDVWGIDFMGPFLSSSGNRYILVAIDYVSKWVKAQALPTNDARVVVKFLKKLFTRFVIPKAFISDRGSHFCNAAMEKVLERYGVTHHRALWALKTINFDLTLAAMRRYFQIHELEALTNAAYERSWNIKEKTKALHDRRLKDLKEFKVGDKVLLYNSRFKLFPEKLKSKWTGPYVVKEVFAYGAIELFDEVTKGSWKVNGHRLKHYLGGPIDKTEREETPLEDIPNTTV
ncbi:uncharacterized protein LOC110906616 [Helianthus annuus]|uniref:uncharacterized protein LOC110906616 n=1 Tax=Helianthus annuus TaxID=4232 RepID=UPI000B907C21|nr:uncharacterized protein LOC110906616 [Helianthus annuus]